MKNTWGDPTDLPDTAWESAHFSLQTHTFCHSPGDPTDLLVFCQKRDALYTNLEKTAGCHRCWARYKPGTNVKQQWINRGKLATFVMLATQSMLKMKKTSFPWLPSSPSSRSDSFNSWFLSMMLQTPVLHNYINTHLSIWMVCIITWSSTRSLSKSCISRLPSGDKCGHKETDSWRRSRRYSDHLQRAS